MGKDIDVSFLLSALLGGLAIISTTGLKLRSHPTTRETSGQITRVYCDRRLVILLVFTLAIFLASFVFERFASCISQILMVDHSSEAVVKIVSLLITTNEMTVVLFQYITGNVVIKFSATLGFLLGTLCLAAGLFIFSLAGENRMTWMLGMFFFSFGEIIFAPLQYRVIDQISLPEGRAFYFSFQNLGSLGGALNPAVTGVLLAFMQPRNVPWVLMLVSVLCFVLFYIGLRLSRRLTFSQFLLQNDNDNGEH